MNFYTIRLYNCGTADFITTNGYAMLFITLPVKHNFPGHIMVVSPKEFEKILMFQGPNLEFNDQLHVGNDPIFLPLEQLDSNVIPPIEKILAIPPVNVSVDNQFSVSNFKLLAEYCDIIKITEFRQQFTGDQFPTIISGVNSNWKIYFMPLEP